MGCHTWFYEPSNGPEALPSNTNGIKYDFVDDFHDVFRVGYGSSEDVELFSLEETLEFIRNNDCSFNEVDIDVNSIPEEVVSRLAAYWNEYPNGMIDFG